MGSEGSVEKGIIELAERQRKGWLSVRVCDCGCVQAVEEARDGAKLLVLRFLAEVRCQVVANSITACSLFQFLVWLQAMALGMLQVNCLQAQCPYDGMGRACLVAV